MSRKSKAPIDVFSALADATRCQIVEILRDGPVPVHELAERFPISRPAISRHLRVLKAAGLVTEVKKGRENFYAFQRGRIAGAERWLVAISTAPQKPGAHASEEKAAPNRNGAKIAGKKAKPARPEPAAPLSVTRTKKPKPELEPALNQMGFDF